MNATFSPVLTQLYVQPFTFAGEYRSFREWRAPRTFDFVVYGRDHGSTLTRSQIRSTRSPGGPAASFTLSNPAFRFRSLRSNTVLRWEFRPGSTLFVVWTQSRSGFFLAPTFDVWRDLGRDLFRDRPTNAADQGQLLS